MPGTYQLDEWLKAAEPIFFEAVASGIRPQRLASMGGVFFLAAQAVMPQGWNARVSDYRKMGRLATEAWEFFEDEIRATAAQGAGRDRAVEVSLTSMRAAPWTCE